MGKEIDPERDLPATGLLRYRAGILVLTSIILIFFAASYLVGEIDYLKGTGARESGIPVIAPDGGIDFFPEGTTIAVALDTWGMDVSGFSTDTLDTPIVEGCRIEVAEDGGGREVIVSPLSNRELFLLGIPFDINSAGAEDLTLIPGIGEVTAGWIVDYRKENGPYLNVRDLLKIRGIGRVKAKKIAEYVMFDVGSVANFSEDFD